MRDHSKLIVLCDEIGVSSSNGCFLSGLYGKRQGEFAAGWRNALQWWTAFFGGIATRTKLEVGMTEVLFSVALPLGVSVRDLCFGDPHWMPHPVRAIGWLITHLEKVSTDGLSQNAAGERIAGIFFGG